MAGNLVLLWNFLQMVHGVISTLKGFNETEVRFKLATVQRIWQRFMYQDSILLEAERQKIAGHVEDWATAISELSEDDVFATFVQVTSSCSDHHYCLSICQSNVSLSSFWPSDHFFMSSFFHTYFVEKIKMSIHVNNRWEELKKCPNITKQKILFLIDGLEDMTDI